VSAFNAAPYLAEALESLRLQSLENFEVIVIDDGSSDSTAEIAGDVTRRDDRFRLLRNGGNRGLVFTRNRALGESTADLVAIADADDICEPNRLAVQVAYLDAHADIGVIGSDVTLIDEDGKRIGSHSQQYRTDRHIRFFLMFGPCLHNPTTMYRRDLLERVGGYQEGWDAGAEDYQLWGRLSLVTGIANVPQALVRYRKHAHSVTADRTGVDANIFAISADLLSRYLERPVATEEARVLHLWLIRHGLDAIDCRRALALANSIWQLGSTREKSDTLSLLGNSFATAAWAHAQYMVYADRRLSFELARFATKVSRVVARPGMIAYAGRLATPNAIRSLLKSLTQRS
jgi:glycosyltransferase involved in cell wall biosynthesis